MPQLANKDVAAVFAISAGDWKAINKRVGAVMALVPVQDDITPYIAAYPDLKGSCTLWQINVFPGLINQSIELSDYANKAIANFTELHSAIKQLGQASDVPPGLQVLTMLRLQQLKDDTKYLSNAFGVLSLLLLEFLKNNEVADLQMSKNKDKLDIFWQPLGQSINALEKGTGNVTGVWNAISDDLNHAIGAPVNVTKPFLEALNLEVAIKSWKAVQTEASSFAVNVNGQAKYWFNPFED